MADNRCPSRLTTDEETFPGPITFRCSLGAGHFPMTPHTWALVWTDLGADQPPVDPEFNSPDYWAQLQDNAGKDRP